MPRIIDYSTVLECMRGQGLVCNYYNSGAFGFDRSAPAQTIAWVGPPDESIRPEVRPLIRTIPEPYEPNLASLATRAWQQHIRGRIWVMPMSHWAYELDFGSRDWMPTLLETILLSAADLSSRTNAAAIEFDPPDHPQFRIFLQGLLTHLAQSDFLIASPERPVVCMIHHHKQLWWTTTQQALFAELERILESLGQVG